jgi:hypothetical protein
MKTDEDKKLLNMYTKEEKAKVLFDIRAELARARVGYSGLVDPPENFQLIQRVPIYPTLNEFIFMTMIFNVEAARNLVFLMFLKPKIGKEVTTLPSASDTPRAPLPASS